jgi:hypothetical protein
MMDPVIKAGRAVCPKCSRKGVGYAPHADAFGWKDYSRARCRYCSARFKIISQREPPQSTKSDIAR